MTLVPSMSQAAVRYVDSNLSGGAADGVSWANAFHSLQDALAVAASGDEVWVAAGVYYPDEGTGQTDDEVSATFVLNDGVELYGGFENGQVFGERDPKVSVTILSGDLQQDDSDSDGNLIAETTFDRQGANARHVVTVASGGTSVLIDGFVVTAGDSSNIGSGGALLIEGTATMVRTCQFFGNTGANAGAVDSGNSGSSFIGCLFSGNKGVFRCGALSAVGSNSVVDCVFEYNSAPNQGGALRLNGGKVANCRFVGNSVAADGGAIYASGSPHIVNCVFHNNLAANGVVYLNSGIGSDIWSSTFSGNKATLEGAAIFLNETGTTDISHCVIWDNESSGGGSASDVFVSSQVIPTYRHCLIEGWNPAGIGNMNGTVSGNAPLFIEPARVEAATIAEISAVDLRMKKSSPTINRGDMAFLHNDSVDIDFDGNTTEDLPLDFDRMPRVIFGDPDLGAFESSESVVFVDRGVSGGMLNGLSWSDAYSSLAAALENVLSGQQIWVAEGTYYATAGNSAASGPRDPLVSFELKSGVTLYGGFQGTEAEVNERDFTENTSILSGDIDEDDTAGIAGMNSYHVVDGSGVDSSAVLDGFTVSNGFANGSFPDNSGGGILLDNGSPVVRNCIFSGNHSAGPGGAVMCTSASSPVFLNTLFVANQASAGSVVSTLSTTAEVALVNCTITQNQSVDPSAIAGAIYNVGSSFLLSNSIVWLNGVVGLNRFDAYKQSVVNTLGGTTACASSLIDHSNGSGNSWELSIGSDEGGNLDVDPLFVSTDDPRIRHDSPAIDQGDNDADLDGGGPGVETVATGLLLDALGEERIVDGDDNAVAIVDMGGHEYQGKACTDFDDDGLSDLFELSYGSPSSASDIVAEADGDNDGFTNLEEFVFGLNPDVYNEEFVSGLTSVPSSKALRYYFTYNSLSEKFVDLTFLWSIDLMSWNEVQASPIDIGNGFYNLIVDENVDQQPKYFLRYEVEKK